MRAAMASSTTPVYQPAVGRLNPMSRRTRILVWVGVALVAWFAFVTIRWAAQPLDDTMAVGLDAKTAMVYRHVECSTLFDSNALGGKPLPVLETPEGVEQQWAFPRSPCALVQDQARLLFGIDVATFVLGAAALIAVFVRPRRPFSPWPSRPPFRAVLPTRWRS